MRTDTMPRAILVWVAKGKAPTEDDFSVGEVFVEDSPGRRLEPKLVLEAALTRAGEVMEDLDSDPWIKAGVVILPPDAVRRAYLELKPTRKTAIDRAMNEDH